MKINATSCIVLYKSDVNYLQRIIFTLLNNEFILKVYLVDNSFTDELKILVNDSRIEYIHNPSNPGFGAAHNLAIQKAIESGSKYHFIINPDVYFDYDVIPNLLEFMVTNSDVGMIMPKIINFDGSIQFLPKLLPSPFSILMRKFKMPNFIYQEFINKYELRSIPQDLIYNTPILSGCFTLLNLKAIKEMGMYDDNYYMYFEDWDLSRRIHQKYRTLYYPFVSVYHGYESGANKSFKLFKIFIRSAFIYFNKWGWIFDKERKKVNNRVLSQFK